MQEQWKSKYSLQFFYKDHLVVIARLSQCSIKMFLHTINDKKDNYITNPYTYDIVNNC